MDCREFLHRYSEYDDSLVPAEEADRFRAHMAECPSCARYDRVLRKGRMLARQLPAPEPSPDFIPRLQRRLLQLRSGRRELRSPRLAAGLAAATILMVAASAVELMDVPPAPEVDTVALAETTTPTAAPDPAHRVLPHLPAAGSGVTRAWTVKMVATAGTSSYSPLVMGPPVFRARAPSSPGITDSYRRLLD